MNPRHLWDANLIEEGNHQVIWELLFDIWNFYTNRQRQSKEKRLKNQENFFFKICKIIKKLLIKEKTICKSTHEKKFIKISRDRLIHHKSDFNKFKKTVNN